MLRSGMYLGAAIDGNKPNGGIYTMLRDVLNNSINEFEAGYGDAIPQNNPKQKRSRGFY